MNTNVLPSRMPDSGTTGVGRYEFVILSSLRAHQLMAGSIPRMTGDHKKTTIACMEVAAGHIISMPHAAAATTALLDDHVGIPVIGSI